ncbi:MAG TPA: PP2C family protein-serine/threonine phosphatase [Vicinamibacterales bacterium]
MISAADLAGAMLGMLFLTLGLAAIGAAALRAVRQDRTLLWFGVFTLLYGLRLIARSYLVHLVTPLSIESWRVAENVMTYIILVPVALLASEALASGPRDVLRYLWMIDLVCAFLAITWDAVVGQSAAAMPFNRALVVGNIAVAAVSVAPDTRHRRWTRDGWIVLAGAAFFAAIAIVRNVRPALLGPVDTEPFAMLLLIGCIGYVVVNRVFQTERRVAAIARELETARQIQRSILPKRPPVVEGLSIAAHYDSMAEVAGDLYDFHVTPSGQLGILVADVSGHGVPAAIVASMVKMALAVQEGDIDDPGDVLMRMNRALSGRFELAYVTATFALIDTAARTLTYASAGHPSPLLVRANGGVDSLDERGIVLGFLPGATYTSAIVRDLAAGDRLVFYTDGITEASRGDGEFFGDRQFRDALTSGRSEPAERFLATLVDRARQWTGADFADDVTIVVVDWIRGLAT